MSLIPKGERVTEYVLCNALSVEFVILGIFVTLRPRGPEPPPPGINFRVAQSTKKETVEYLGDTWYKPVNTEAEMALLRCPR